jgi:hypothetical protein
MKEAQTCQNNGRKKTEKKGQDPTSQCMSQGICTFGYTKTDEILSEGSTVADHAKK